MRAVKRRMQAKEIQSPQSVLFQPRISFRGCGHCWRRLERVTQGKLESTDQSGFRGHLSKLGRSRIQVRRAPVGVIGEVVGLAPELEVISFVDGKPLEHGYVPVLQAWLVNGIPHSRLKVEGAGRGRSKVGGELFHRAGLAGWSSETSYDVRRSTENPELTLGTASEAAEIGRADACEIVVGSDAARLSRLKLNRSAKAPSAQQFSGQTRVILEERQIVQIVNDHDVPYVEFGRPPEITRIVSIRDNVAVIRAVVAALRKSVGEIEH